MMTKIPKYPRYIRSTAYALEALFVNKVESFPIDVRIICKNFGIKLKKYSVLAKKNSISVSDIGEAYKTKLGYIYRNEKGKYFIAYNDTLPEGLIRFTLAHELGHFFLNHLEDFEETELMYNSLVPYSDEHECLEKEANCFARNFLSPSYIAKFAGNELHSMQFIFGLTYKASSVRLNSLHLDEKNVKACIKSKITNNDNILSYLSDIGYKHSYLIHCNKCNGEFSSIDAKYCGFCGNNDLLRLTLAKIPKFRKSKGAIVMKYSKIETNDNEMPLQCPKCKYENLNDEFNYCPICTTFLKNICLGDEFYSSNGEHIPYHQDQYNACSGSLSGDHRYCTKCGSPSSYNSQNLLTSWDEEIKQIEKKSEDPFSNMPPIDIPDHDLPF